jgi:hypothetical protein
MVLPHWTSWRICSVALVDSGKCGVVLGGVAETGPVCAKAATGVIARPARLRATAAARTPDLLQTRL